MNKVYRSFLQKELQTLIQRLPRTQSKASLCWHPWKQSAVERGHCEGNGPPQIQVRRPRVKCLPAALNRMLLALLALLSHLRSGAHRRVPRDPSMEVACELG